MPPSLARERTTGKLSCGLMIERCPPVLQVQSGFSSTGCNLHIYEGTINTQWYLQGLEQHVLPFRQHFKVKRCKIILLEKNNNKCPFVTKHLKSYPW